MLDTVEVYADFDCAGAKKFDIKTVNQCFTFGAFKPIHSAKTVGTCN